MLTLATIISRLFEPMLVIALTTALVVTRSGLTAQVYVVFLLILFFVMVLSPTLFRFWLVRTKRVSAWDIPIRTQRIVPLVVLACYVVATYFLLATFRNEFLLRLFRFYIFWIIGFILVTLKWKISGHAAVVSLAVGLILLELNLIWWPILVLVPLVAWARIVTENHTIGQVVGGVSYSLFLLVFYFYTK